MRSLARILIIITLLFIPSAGMAMNTSQSDTSWMTMESGMSGFFRGVWGASSSEIFIAGGEYDYNAKAYRGIILRSDGKGWKTDYSALSQSFNGVWGRSGSDIFVVGQAYDDAISQGLILHYDGSDWTLTRQGDFGPLNDVWGIPGSDVFAVGDAGTILHFDGAEWHEMESPAETDLRSLWGNSASGIFAVGNAGAILHFDGIGWTEMSSGTENDLKAVWGISETQIYAVGDTGLILHFDGAQWRETDSPTDVNLRSVWGNDIRSLFAAGDGGTVLRSDGTEWHKTETGTENRLRSLWGLPGIEPADLFAVGDFGVILRYLPLTLELPESATEEDGVLRDQGIVRSVYAADSDLTIHLMSENDSEISVPPSVVIPAGQTSVRFDLTLGDDTLLDGSPNVRITASASGYSPVAEFVRVIDSETAGLRLMLPEIVTEGDGASEGTVSVSTAVEKDVRVSLLSGDTSEIRVPESIVIPSGQTSAVFDLTIIDDTETDGAQTAVISASVEGWTSGENTIAINDNEVRELVVSFDPQTFSEEDGVVSDAGTVSVPGTLVSDLEVHLSSDSPLKISVPAAVTIPLGESSARFDLTLIEDSGIDGNHRVTITASAEGWVTGSNAIEVRDNDPGTLRFDSETYEALETGGSVTITVIRELSTTGRITADYTTEDETAAAEEDYTAASGTLVFEEGETSKSFSLPILDDSLAEGDETIRLFLVRSSGGAKLGDPAVVTITDDEMSCLTAEAGDGEVRLNWCEPFQTEGFTGYNVYREGTKVNSAPVTEMSYTVTESEHGRYCYTVETLYENKANKMSNQVCTPVASDYALSFDGKSAYAGISVISGLDFSANQSFTVELWVKADEERSDPAIISNKNWDSGYNTGFILAQTDKTWKANIGDGSKIRADINDIGDIRDGEWHHLAMVIDREDQRMKVFHDGNKKGETDISDIRDMNTDLALNVGQDGRGLYRALFKGAVDDVRVWRVARTNEEIRSSVFTRLTGKEPGLSLYWQMDKASSGELADQSGNGNHGTIQKGAAWIQGVPFEDILLNRSLKAEVRQEGNVCLTWEYPDDLTGYNVYRNGSKINTDILTAPAYTDSDIATDNSYCYSIAPVYAETGEGNITDEICVDIASEYALRLDGENAYAELPGADVLELRYNDFTVEAWVSAEDTAHYQPILSASPQLFLGIRDRRPYMSFELDNPKEANDLEGDMVIHENNCYHIAWRYSRTEGPIGEQAIFVNGISAGSEDGHYAFQGLGAVEIGRIGTICFNGMIDELRIWNTARTEAEIASAMYTKLTGNEAGLTAYLPADEWRSILADRSGNENHGTMMMGASYSKSASYAYLSRIPRFPNLISSDAEVWLSWTSPGHPENLLGYNILRDGMKINTEILTDTIYTDTEISSGDIYCYTVEAAYPDTDETALSNDLCLLTAQDYALSFNGTDNYAGIRNLSGLDFSADQSFTVELWVKAAEKDSDPAIISNKDWDLGRNKGFVFAQVTSNWKVNIGDGSDRIDMDMPVLPVSEWEHLAMVIDRETQQIRMFQDGDKVAEADISAIGDMNSGLGLNIAQDGTCIYHDYFKGEIDEVRVWSVARTDAEIISSMFTRLLGKEPGLAAYWSVDQWNISEFTDKSSNGNHGRIYGATPVSGIPMDKLGKIPQNLLVMPDPDAGLSRLSWNAPNLHENLSGYHILRNGEFLDTGILTETTYTDTDLFSEKPYCYAVQAVYNETVESSPSDEACTVITYNYAPKFDKNDYALIPNEAHFDFEKAITLEAWIQVSQFDKEWQTIVAKGNDSWRLQRYKTSNNIEFVVGDSYIAGNMDVNDGDWHHVAGICDGDTFSLYIDGKLDNSASAEPIDAINTDEPVMIGENSEARGRNFDGKICEVRVWSVARTQKEIRETLHKRLSGNEDGLAGYWPMNEPGETLTDYSGNGNHGTIYGAEWLQGAPIAE